MAYDKASALVTFKTGKLDSNAAEPKGKYPFFTCAKTTYRINTYAFDTECVLLAGNNAGGIFPLKYFSGRFNAYQRTYVIESKDSDRTSIKFFYYFLRPYLRAFEQQATGATTKFLTIRILHNVLVPAIGIESQRKIAAVLSAYDDLIENNRRRIALLERMAEQLYREWFVRFRFPGYQQTKFEKGLPVGWGSIPTSKAFQFTGGATPAKDATGYWKDGTINWFTPSDITASEGLFLPESSLRCTEEGLANCSAKLFPPYSVMMTSRATIGAIGINTTEACTNQGFIACMPNERYPLGYLYHWLKLSKEYFLSLCGGATFPELTKGTFKRIEVLTPPPSLVTEFERKVAPMFKSVELLQKANVSMVKTRDLLLPRLISGKLRVDELDIRFPPSMQTRHA